MIQSETGIFTRHTADTVYIRVNGRGAFPNSHPLRRYAANMIQRGKCQIVLDLEQCAGMDSTFLGVLTGIGLSLRQQNPPGAVHVINANRHSCDLLKSLWLDRLFRVYPEGVERPDFGEPAGGELQKLTDSDLSAGLHWLPHEETRELVLTAHQDLIRADSRNAPKFAEVTNQLGKEAQLRRPE